MFEQLCANAQSNLKRFEVRRLAEYEEHGVEYSELLSFYVFLLSGRVQKVRLKRSGEFFLAVFRRLHRIGVSGYSVSACCARASAVPTEMSARPAPGSGRANTAKASPPPV